MLHQSQVLLCESHVAAHLLIEAAANGLYDAVSSVKWKRQLPNGGINPLIAYIKCIKTKIKELRIRMDSVSHNETMTMFFTLYTFYTDAENLAGKTFFFFSFFKKNHGPPHLDQPP